MLEKNNDYIETLVSSTDCAFTQNALTQISVDGHVYTPYMDLPTPGEFYIIISKEKFEKMQADDQYYRELAKQWEENYNLLLKKIGFDTVEELVNYLDSEAECDTLHEALASLEYNVKFARDERRDLSKKLEECEKDYISERDKAEALEQEWKEGTGCPSPSSAKALIESMNAALRASNIAMQKEIDSWQVATGRIGPEEAKQYIDRLKDRLNKIHYCSVDW